MLSMILSKRNTLSRRNADKNIAPLLTLTASGAALILLLVLFFLLRESWPVLSNGGWQRFISDESWHPLEGRFGLLPMVWATLAVACGAIAIAAPLGLAGALFEYFYAPPILARAYRMMVVLLTGIPSVVFGLWGLTVLVPLIARWQPPGASLFTAIIILALMILPTVALTGSAALRGVPTSLLHGAAALGMTRKGVITGVAIPAARSGIIGGVLLATARALGETMAVLMVAGNVVQTPTGLFEPVRVLTANIALEMAYATGDHRAGLFASGLLLTLMVLVLAGLAARSTRRG
jgi:phosphate transport system permease protein